MTDLTHVSTADLVLELEGREGVISPHPELWYGCVIDALRKGPATILVVRGERE